MQARSLAAMLGAVLIVASCSRAGDGRSATLENDIFLSTALAHAQSELELAQMARQKAHTRSVVAYAQRISGERAPQVDQLSAAAKAAGVSADTNHSPNTAAYKPLEGEAFERAYVAAQIEDQQNAIDIYDFASQNSNDANLRKLAVDALPQLRQDLADAIGVVKDIPFESTSDSSQGVIVAPRRR
jgi:predicted outer membrane protein